MFFLVALLPFLALASAAHNPPHLRHRRLAHSIQMREETPNGAKLARADAGHADALRVIKRTVVKRGQTCRPRQKAAQAVVAPSPSASSAVASSSAAAASPTIENQNYIAQHSSAAAPWHSPAAPPPAPPKPSPPAPPPQQGGGGGGGGVGQNWGTLQVNDGKCGWCNSNGDQPNGSQDWLNCGLNSGGWTPPHVTVDQLITKELDAHGVFAPCAQYFDLFRQYGGEFHIPPIMLASFAIQESTCNPGVTGGGGEAGMMQIAPPNCEAGNNCWDLHYNVRRGAQLFRQMLDANGGNVLASIGAYNGWRKGMTVDDATRARWTGNCRNQNNLDYLTQFLNAWVLGKDGHSVGSYWNLKDC